MLGAAFFLAVAAARDSGAREVEQHNVLEQVRRLRLRISPPALHARRKHSNERSLTHSAAMCTPPPPLPHPYPFLLLTQYNIVRELEKSDKMLKLNLNTRLAWTRQLRDARTDLKGKVVSGIPQLDAALCSQTTSVVIDNGRELPPKFITVQSSAQGCCEECASQERCGAWTYNEESTKCFLRRRRGWLRHLEHPFTKPPHLEELGSAIWRPGRVSGRVAIGQGARTVQEHSRAAIRALARLSLTQSRRGARYSIDDLKFLDDEVRWRCRMNVI